MPQPVEFNREFEILPEAYLAFPAQRWQNRSNSIVPFVVNPSHFIDIFLSPYSLKRKKRSTRAPIEKMLSITIVFGQPMALAALFRIDLRHLASIDFFSQAIIIAP
tara:strand:+ start:217 stop:534 length:318 start_codon:yes stop_codon:yes gene_type:complete